MEDPIVQLIALILPALVVFATAYYILKKFMEEERAKRQYQMKKEFTKGTTPVRLQAFERLVLLMERLAPNNLIYRIKQPGMSAQELHVSLLQEIRREFDHNLSQQLYVSNDAWEQVVNAKEELKKTINLSMGDVDKETATAMDLSKAIFERVMALEVPPNYRALAYLKAEARQMF